MSKLFNKSMMKAINVADLKNWKELVEKGVDILVEHGYATNKLTDAILDSTEKYGAYYVLEKGLAFLHAPVGEYNLKTGISIILLDDFIEFNNQSDKLGKIIITLSAIDNSSHMNLLEEFGKYFMNEEFKKEAFKINDIDTFLKLVDKYK
ncbi:PTS sugar transporter subunit IIA [Mycoplasmopsis lipofaciens]|uniref:PTS sugar transporter subunit IIA n=1 Tax=Mycoplasmopsis lipofaciens TaxID=114884 RepID=UPI0004840003|nr:PTS sugar transporter subunit IIA [Mycoplasmopsis lipofaciens]